ncbi:MAG: FkbM family methyltransferase [Xanthobacteraceae bacterium]
MITRAPIRFDRSTGVLEEVNAWERFAVLLLIGGAKVSARFSHHGYRWGCNMLRWALPSREVAMKLGPDATFIFPYGDGYWSKMLDRSFRYEEELELLLRAARDVDYTLIDCGANFGFFSVLVSSPEFGSRPSIAIEPSSANYELLTRSAAANGNRFRTIRAAIGAERGTARLSGFKHEGLSIVGESSAGGEEVPVIAVDNLVDDGIIAADGKYVIKLDVEGVEIEALKGAARLLTGDSIAVCEDHGSDRNHTVSRFILGETALKLVVFDPVARRFERLTDVAPLDRIKNARIGYNVFATASPFWLDFIERLNASPALRAMRD